MFHLAIRLASCALNGRAAFFKRRFDQRKDEEGVGDKISAPEISGLFEEPVKPF